MRRLGFVGRPAGCGAWAAEPRLRPRARLCDAAWAAEPRLRPRVRLREAACGLRRRGCGSAVGLRRLGCGGSALRVGLRAAAARLWGAFGLRRLDFEDAGGCGAAAARSAWLLANGTGRNLMARWSRRLKWKTAGPAIT
jgi:hypothetical protein